MAAEVYVPVYSRLVYSEGRGVIELSALLTIRNTDPTSPIVIEAVRYYDSSGKLLRDEVSAPGVLAPMASASLLLKKSDEAGGTGASYLVRWRSANPVTEPVLEVLMADLSMSHSLAFTSRGIVTRSSKGAPLPELATPSK